MRISGIKGRRPFTRIFENIASNNVRYMNIFYRHAIIVTTWYGLDMAPLSSSFILHQLLYNVNLHFIFDWAIFIAVILFLIRVIKRSHHCSTSLNAAGPIFRKIQTRKGSILFLSVLKIRNFEVILWSFQGTCWLVVLFNDSFYALLRLTQTRLRWRSIRYKTVSEVLWQFCLLLANEILWQFWLSLIRLKIYSISWFILKDYCRWNNLIFWFLIIRFFLLSIGFS